MSKDTLFEESLKNINEISNNRNAYIAGILLKDYDSQKHIEILAHMQSIIMQSIQLNNFKRALRYIVVFNKRLKNYNILADRLKESITDYIISN